MYLSTSRLFRRLAGKKAEFNCVFNNTSNDSENVIMALLHGGLCFKFFQTRIKLFDSCFLLVDNLLLLLNGVY